LVIDDICEGGRTFIELAKLFKEVKGKETQINLYVTHGIFSNNAVEKLLDFYSKIYVNFMKESDYDKLTDSQQDNVFVNTLINA
jgi:ribose-phosphate pyrophosphokinase